MKQYEYDIDNIFTYHSPLPEQQERYEMLRNKAKELAQLILDECSPSRERSLALTKTEEAIMWANAAIARNEAKGIINHNDKRLVGESKSKMKLCSQCQAQYIKLDSEKEMSNARKFDKYL